MRQWQGQRSDVPQVGGSHFIDCRGVSFSVDGQLSRRPGLTYVASEGALLIGSIRSQATGSFLVLVQSTGNVEAVAL